MAKGSAASISTTFGAAAATLVIAGAILAWPTLSVCGADARGFGACLRDSLADRGLLPADDISVDNKGGEADPPLPIPRPAQEGWLAAIAAEPPAPELGVVELTAPPPGIMAGVSEAPPPPTPSVALAPTAPLAAELAAEPSKPADVVQLEGSAGTLTAMAAKAPEDEVATVALAAPQGALNASGSAVPERDVPVMNILDQIDRRLSAGSAEPETPPAAPVAVEPLPVKPAPPPRRAPAKPKPAPPPVELQAEAAPERPPVKPVYNPAFPNVVVLPAPAAGENSSIRTLTLN